MDLSELLGPTGLGTSAAHIPPRSPIAGRIAAGVSDGLVEAGAWIDNESAKTVGKLARSEPLVVRRIRYPFPSRISPHVKAVRSALPGLFGVFLGAPVVARELESGTLPLRLDPGPQPGALDRCQAGDPRHRPDRPGARLIPPLHLVVRAVGVHPRKVLPQPRLRGLRPRVRRQDPVRLHDLREHRQLLLPGAARHLPAALREPGQLPAPDPHDACSAPLPARSSAGPSRQWRRPRPDGSPWSCPPRLAPRAHREARHTAHHVRTRTPLAIELSGGNSISLGTSAPHRAWELSRWTQDAAGHHLTSSQIFALLQQAHVNFAPHAPGAARVGQTPPPGSGISPQAFADWLAQHGCRLGVSYQPASRFWHFQGVEAAAYVVLGLLCAAATIWWIRRRTNGLTSRTGCLALPEGAEPVPCL